MGVPDPFRDSSLLREHAYYDTGDVDYVIPPSDSNKKMGFMSIKERGLGNFDYSSTKPLYSSGSETEVAASSLLYISCILLGVLVVFTIVFYIIKSSPKETLAIKSKLNNMVKKRNRSSRKLKGILPMSHTPDSTPPSLSSTPELSDVESFESPSRNFKFDTIVDDLSHTLKSWTVNEFELDNLRVH
ncbi:hypothetical protein CLIB1423_20S00584 [[Candida] railenensis]|uniref:Uncharacterized protein n=1 Tax=[Candida] railenensis TaxID=45579 RepID=A0A9P0W0S2_9ASCO|nr:hypothetical protein CLIB1423_20S00584 [[Candida] railenensis]